MKGQNKRSLSAKRNLRPISAKTTKPIKCPMIIKSRPMIDPNKTSCPNPESEDLYKEILILKDKINSFKEEVSYLKSNKEKLNKEISLKEKEINNLMNIILKKENAKDKNIPSSVKEIEETCKRTFLQGYKRKYRELEENLEAKEKELLALKKNINTSSLREEQIQNEVLLKQFNKIRHLYQHSLKQTSITDSLCQEVNLLKGESKVQQGVILVLKENLEKTTKQVKEKDKEIAELNKKNEQIGKNLRFLQNENKKANDKMKMILRGEVHQEDWKAEKQKMEEQLEKVTKDLEYYKTQSVKNKYNEPPQEKKPALPPERPRVTVLRNPEEITDTKILFMRSLIQELQEENAKLKEKISSLENQPQSNLDKNIIINYQ